MEGQKELFVPLSDVIKKVIPTSSWNFVEFYMKFKTQFRDGRKYYYKNYRVT